LESRRWVRDKIVLHSHGWIEVSGQSPIQAELIELAAFLNGSELMVESRRDCLFRLSITPETIFFTDALFSFAIMGDDLKGTERNIQATICRQSFETAFGVVKEKTEHFDLTRGYAKRLKMLADAVFNVNDKMALSTEENYKKGLHQDVKFKGLGLRNLIRREGNIIKFVVTFNCS